MRKKVLDISYKDKEVNALQIANKLRIGSNEAFKCLFILESEEKVKKRVKRIWKTKRTYWKLKLKDKFNFSIKLGNFLINDVSTN